MTTEEKIRSFAALPPGWHFGQGVPPPPERVDQALRLLAAGREAGWPETDAFPGVDGEVRITFYREDGYLELTLERDGGVSVVREQNGVERETRFPKPPLSEEERAASVARFLELWPERGLRSRPSLWLIDLTRRIRGWTTRFPALFPNP